MKNLIRRFGSMLILVAAVMVALPIVAQAQDLGDIQSQFTGALLNVAALGIGCLFFSELIEKIGWHLQAGWAQARAIVVAVVLGEIGAYFHTGMFSDPAACGTLGWYICGGAVGVVAGCGANWGFTTPIGQAVLAWLKIRVPAGGSTLPQKTNAPNDPANVQPHTS